MALLLGVISTWDLGAWFVSILGVGAGGGYVGGTLGSRVMGSGAFVFVLVCTGILSLKSFGNLCGNSYISSANY